jgi:hypothetical protein
MTMHRGTGMSEDDHLCDQWAQAIVVSLKQKVAAGELGVDTAAIAGLYAAFNLAKDMGLRDKAVFQWMRAGLRTMELHDKRCPLRFDHGRVAVDEQELLRRSAGADGALDRNTRSRTPLSGSM